MEFGTTTRIIIEDQKARAIEPPMKTLIIGAAQQAVAGHPHRIEDEDFAAEEPFDGGTLDIADIRKIDGQTIFNGELIYAALRGKPAGNKDDILLCETANVRTDRACFRDFYDTLQAFNEKYTGSLTADVPIKLDTDRITISDYGLLKLVYQYYDGSPIMINNDSTSSTLKNIPAVIKARMKGKDIVCLFTEDNAHTYTLARFVASGDDWICEDGLYDATDVAIYEDPFHIYENGVAHGMLYLDIVYNETADTIANQLYYIEEMDDIREIFGSDALSLIPSGAAYNAHKYLLTNGGKAGFYVYAAEAVDGANNPTLYLDETAIGLALADTIKYKDIYDVIPITYKPEALTALEAHITAMADPDMRRERRGYGGLYLEAGTGTYEYEEFEHLCEIGPNGERNYLLGKTEENGGTGRYGGRNAYITAMSNICTYNTPKLTLCETKYGIIDKQYVTASTLMAIYVGYRNTMPVGYVMAETVLPLISKVSFSGLFNDMEHLDAMQNLGIMSIYQATAKSPVMVYYPCTTAIDYVQNMEEYLVIATDMFAREVRASLRPHIGRGEYNKISEGFTGEKATKYLKKLESFLDAVKYRYVNKFRVFSNVELIGITVNPDYEGGVIIKIRLTYLYAVNAIEVTIYI